MTLPPRLTDRTFEPDRERARTIVATARRRRRTRAGAAGLSVAAAVGVVALAAPGGTSGLRPVDPITSESAQPAGTATRTTTAYDASEVCSAHSDSVVRASEQKDPSDLCLRWSWPAEVAAGEPVTFTVEQCATEVDITATFDDRPHVSVRGDDVLWTSEPGTGGVETLRAGTCWVSTVRWNGTLRPGTYEVEVQGTNAKELVYRNYYDQDPDRQRTLVVR